MNKNPVNSYYESGEIVFGTQSRGPGWIKLDGGTYKISNKLSSKLGVSTTYTTPIINPGYNIYGWMKL